MARTAVTLLVLGVLAFAGCASPPAPAPTNPVTLPVDTLASFDGLGSKVATPADVQGLDIILRPTARRGAEPNIGVTSNGHIFVTAGGLVLRSEDGGATWAESFNLSKFWGPAYDSPIPNNSPVGDPVYGLTRSSDPMLWVDPDTDRIFADFMTGLYCSKMFISDDGGMSWLPSPIDCGVPVNDHQKVATARFGPGAPKPENPVYPNVVYYCYNKLVATHCAVSLDGGLSFSYDRPITVGLTSGDEVPQATPTAPCGGINGHPAGAPDGTKYVPLNLGCPAPVVAVSLDNGLTWDARVGPDVHGAEEIDSDITVTPDGTAYMLYRGSDHLQYLVRSTDRFLTWEGPWKVSPDGVTSTVFTGITSGDDGRIAMSFLGTRDSSEEPSRVANETRWHLYEVVSLDAAAALPIFTVRQVTTEAEPVQIGCVWLYGGGNPCRNMLDFIDMTRDPAGRALVAFTDGCTIDCDGNATATHEQSRSRIITVAVTQGGPSLFADKPLVAPLDS